MRTFYPQDRWVRALGLIALYAALLTLVGVVCFMSVLVVRSAELAAASETAKRCASSEQRDCLVVEETTVLRKTRGGGGEGDSEVFGIETGTDARRTVIDEDAHSALRVGDTVRLISYNGKVTHVSYGENDSATGVYTKIPGGYTVLLWVAVALLTSVCCATVTLHRTGEFEGYLLFMAFFLIALFLIFSTALWLLLEFSSGTVPAAFVGALLVAAATTASWVSATRGP